MFFVLFRILGYPLRQQQDLTDLPRHRNRRRRIMQESGHNQSLQKSLGACIPR